MIELDSVLSETHQEMASHTTWEYRKSAFSSSWDEIIRFAQSLRGPAPETCGGFCRDSLNEPTSYEEPVMKKRGFRIEERRGGDPVDRLSVGLLGHCYGDGH